MGFSQQTMNDLFDREQYHVILDSTYEHLNEAVERIAYHVHTPELAILAPKFS